MHKIIQNYAKDQDLADLISDLTEQRKNEGSNQFTKVPSGKDRTPANKDSKKLSHEKGRKSSANFEDYFNEE